MRLSQEREAEMRRAFSHPEVSDVDAIAEELLEEINALREERDRYKAALEEIKSGQLKDGTVVPMPVFEVALEALKE